MKTIEIHPLSAALGATFVGLILLTLGLSPVVSSCSSSSSGGTTATTGFGGGEEPYDVTVLNDLTIESMPSVDIATIPAVDIASMPSLDLSLLTSIRVKGIPTHEDFVVIESETPFTVPAGKVFIPTGVVRSHIVNPTAWLDADNVMISFDGVVYAAVTLSGHRTSSDGAYSDDNSVDLPLGLHAPTGVAVNLTGGNDGPSAFRLLGYLEEA